jgi:hypothetical protein
MIPVSCGGLGEKESERAGAHVSTAHTRHAIVCAFTPKSDEIEVLLPDLENPNGQHAFQGKRDKLCTLMAGHAATFLTRRVLRHAEARGVQQVSFELLPAVVVAEADLVASKPATPPQALASLKAQLATPGSPVYQGTVLHFLQATSLHTAFNGDVSAEAASATPIQCKLTLRNGVEPPPEGSGSALKNLDNFAPAILRHFFESDLAKALGVPVRVTSVGAPDFPLLVEGTLASRSFPPFTPQSSPAIPVSCWGFGEKEERTSCRPM